jgi:hypothetical protein
MANDKKNTDNRNITVKIPKTAHKRLQIAKINGENRSLGDLLLQAAALGNPDLFGDCVAGEATAEDE